MRRTISILFVCGFLTVGTVAELSAQAPISVDAMTSSTRRSSLFRGSRADLFRSDGGAIDTNRIELKDRSLAKTDEMMKLFNDNKPSDTFEAPGRNNMDIFLTIGAAMQQLNLADTEGVIDTGAELIIGDIDTDVAVTPGIPAIRQGLYAPRLRYVPPPEELAATQTPEALQIEVDANLLRAEQLQKEIIGKFELPDSANMSLEFVGSTVFVQGRVPSPLQRKQIEMYLGMEPGVYSVQNRLTVDSSLPDDSAASRPRTHSDPEER